MRLWELASNGFITDFSRYVISHSKLPDQLAVKLHEVFHQVESFKEIINAFNVDEFVFKGEQSPGFSQIIKWVQLFQHSIINLAQILTEKNVVGTDEILPLFEYAFRDLTEIERKKIYSVLSVLLCGLIELDGAQQYSFIQIQSVMLIGKPHKFTYFNPSHERIQKNILILAFLQNKILIIINNLIRVKNMLVEVKDITFPLSFDNLYEILNTNKTLRYNDDVYIPFYSAQIGEKVLSHLRNQQNIDMKISITTYWNFFQPNPLLMDLVQQFINKFNEIYQELILTLKTENADLSAIDFIKVGELADKSQILYDQYFEFANCRRHELDGQLLTNLKNGISTL